MSSVNSSSMGTAPQDEAVELSAPRQSTTDLVSRNIEATPSQTLQLEYHEDYDPTYAASQASSEEEEAIVPFPLLPSQPAPEAPVANSISTTGQPAVRRRTRRDTIIGGVYPFDCPNNSDEEATASLIKQINRSNSLPSTAATVKLSENPRPLPEIPESHSRRTTNPDRGQGLLDFLRGTQAGRPQPTTPAGRRQSEYLSRVLQAKSVTEIQEEAEAEESSRPSRGRSRSHNENKDRSSRRSSSRPNEMNYQNYLDSPQVAAGANNNRNAPQSSSQAMNHANGMNGGMAASGAMAGLPTPAGHQADLNHIYHMIEELSGILQENQNATHRINESVGRVREMARTRNMTNDEMIEAAAHELNESTANLEVRCSELEKKLEWTEYERVENLNLCREYARTMGNMLKEVHTFKLKTVEDLMAWHRSYRAQLEWERAENLRLRLEIDDKIEHARRGNEALRKFMRAWDEDEEKRELQINLLAKRQECRWWKRMAMPEAPDDCSLFSDDDDLIDPVEKERLRQQEELEAAKRECDAYDNDKVAAADEEAQSDSAGSIKDGDLASSS